jgi:hypothetical protein
MTGNFKESWRRGRLAACALPAAILAACSGHGGPIPQGGLPPMTTQAQPFASESFSALDEQNATTAPIFWIGDSNGEIWKINLSTLAITRVGTEETLLTDLAFDPINHALYGISFNEFYRVSTSTGIATPIGQLGINDANALVFDKNGRGLTKGYQDTQLYAITNVATGQASFIGNTGKWESAGDLTFYNSTLVLSGYTGDLTTAKEAIVTLNPSTGAVQHVAQTNVVQLYGLVSPSTNHLYGFAGTSMYQLFPGAATAAQRAVLVKNFSGSGVGQILGAAYNGNFQI